MSREFVVQGEMSEGMKRVIAQGEEIVAYQQTTSIAKPLSAIAALVLFVIGIIGLAAGSAGVAVVFWGLAILFGIGWLTSAVHEHAVTPKRLVTGRKGMGQFSFEVVPINKVVAVHITREFALFGKAQMEVLYAGGKTELPILGGQAGRELVFALTRLVQS